MWETLSPAHLHTIPFPLLKQNYIYIETIIFGSFVLLIQEDKGTFWKKILWQHLNLTYACKLKIAISFYDVNVFIVWLLSSGPLLSSKTQSSCS